MARALLLQVADEIEADENYTGISWWVPQASCGCAMIRTLKAAGAEFTFDTEAKPHYSEDGVLRGGEWIEEIQIEGRPYYVFQAPHLVAHLTEVDDRVWDKFQQFSLSADRFQTAEKLRVIAETGQFEKLEEDGEDDGEE